MAVKASKDVAFFLIGGRDVLGSLTEIEDKGVEAVIQETNPFGIAWGTHEFVGIRNWGLTQRGFLDDAAGAVHDALSTGPGVSRVLCYGIGGTATGAQFIGAAGAMQVNYNRIFTRNELSKAEAEYNGNGPVDYNGKIIRTYKVHASTGRTTATPLGELASSTGGVGYLQYNATAGEANIRMIHSSDDVTYATLFTFSKTASGFGAERLTTTGVIERYTAYDVTTASATGAITALNAFMGLSRGYSS